MRGSRRLEGVKEDRSDLRHDGLFQRREVIGQTVERELLRLRLRQRLRLGLRLRLRFSR
jgi:hypothetical protein